MHGKCRVLSGTQGSSPLASTCSLNCLAIQGLPYPTARHHINIVNKNIFFSNIPAVLRIIWASSLSRQPLLQGSKKRFDCWIECILCMLLIVDGDYQVRCWTPFTNQWGLVCWECSCQGSSGPQLQPPPQSFDSKHFSYVGKPNAS